MNSPLERSFAELLSSHRGAADLTQEELAARAGLSVSAISLLERGVRTAPRASTVARLCAALGLDGRERGEFVSAARRRAAARALPLSVLTERRPPSMLTAGGRRELDDRCPTAADQDAAGGCCPDRQAGQPPPETPNFLGRTARSGSRHHWPERLIGVA